MNDGRVNDQRQGYTGGIGSGQGGAPVDPVVAPTPDESSASRQGEHDAAQPDTAAHVSRYKLEYLAELDRRYTEWRAAQERLLDEDFAAYAAETAGAR